MATLSAATPALRPASATEIAAMVIDAAAAGNSLDAIGGGTRSGLGRPMSGAPAMSLAGLSGITLYEPAELVIGARAGTSVAEIERTLAGRGQMLPFEPMDHRALYGTGGEPSIGGVFAGNISGPRRISAGAARDHLLGVTLVNGRGQIVRSGGRVMKNVTGLDLVKLNCGAMGTLGILSEVILKVLPAPEFTATLAFEGLAVADAVGLMSRAMGSPFEIAAAAHLPGRSGSPARTLLRLEGFETAVRHRLGALAERLDVSAPRSILEAGASTALWAGIRDVTALEAPADAEIWRVGVAPAKAPQIVAGIAGLPCFLDWAGGLIWIAAPADAGLETTLRPAVGALSGHATLVRAGEARRREVPVYQPLAAPLMSLTRGLKQSFDPHRIINPGRMYEGI